MKIKAAFRNEKAVTASCNHRLAAFLLLNYRSSLKVYELTRMSNVCPGV